MERSVQRWVTRRKGCVLPCERQKGRGNGVASRAWKESRASSVTGQCEASLLNCLQRRCALSSSVVTRPDREGAWIVCYFAVSSWKSGSGKMACLCLRRTTRSASSRDCTINDDQQLPWARQFPSPTIHPLRQLLASCSSSPVAQPSWTPHQL